jgi:hypothetical protein
MFNILSPASEEIIDSNNIMPILKISLTKVRAKKARSTSYQDSHARWYQSGMCYQIWCKALKFTLLKLELTRAYQKIRDDPLRPLGWKS